MLPHIEDGDGRRCVVSLVHPMMSVDGQLVRFVVGPVRRGTFWRGDHANRCRVIQIGNGGQDSSRAPIVVPFSNVAAVQETNKVLKDHPELLVLEDARRPAVVS